jgi:uncharacterized secreted protein with C-terminal beta-propeller domain
MKKRLLTLLITLSMIVSTGVIVPLSADSINTRDEFIQVNNSKPANLDDAMEILRHLAKIELLTAVKEVRFDFNRDGRITIADALMVLNGLARVTDLPLIVTTVLQPNPDWIDPATVTTSPITTTPQVTTVPPTTTTPQVTTVPPTTTAPQATTTPAPVTELELPDTGSFEFVEGDSWVTGEANYKELFRVISEFQASTATATTAIGTWADNDWLVPVPGMTQPPLMTTALMTTALGATNTAGAGWADAGGDRNTQSMGGNNPAESVNNSGNNDFSDTNNQVEGVQESDIVKTDGRFIYVASTSDRNNLRVSIVRADNGLMTTRSVIRLTGATQLHEMLLWREKLIIIYRQGSQVVVDMYLTNGNFARPTTTYAQDGVFSSARMIDNNIYLITNHNPNLPRTPLAETDITQIVPAFWVNGERHLVPSCKIVLPDRLDSPQYTIIGGLDVHRINMAVSVVTTLGSTNNVYASANNIYVSRVNRVWTGGVGAWQWWSWQGQESETTINKFSVNRGRVQHRASATVNGSARNQFHFDEHEGNLRVVTEVWGNKPAESDFKGSGSWQILPVPEKQGDRGWWDERRRTDFDTGWGLQGGVLYTFDKDMNLLAEVHRIGFGENVHSVRFMGDIGYIVTFWQTDPLFSFDLSDPANPVLLDALKIPGFSRYLDSWTDGLLLGMGVDTNQNGVRQGLKLTMFDVSDNEDLIEKHVVQFGNRGFSPFENDHRAVLLSPERNIIGFPYQVSGTAMYAVYSYDPQTGFKIVGELRADPKQTTTTFWCCPLCGYITRTATSNALPFNRGMFIGNYIYAISDNMIVSARLGETLTEVARLTV